MRSWVLLLAGVGVGAFAAAGLRLWLDILPSRAVAASSPLESPSHTVTPLAAEGFVGVIVPDEAVDIVARIEARIQRVHVRLGDRVLKGQLIATMDTLPLHRELAIAEAQLAGASADSERGSLEHRKANEALERRTALEASRGISGEEVATARFEEKTAQARLDLANATLAERRARVAQLHDKLAEAELRAPFEGTVVGRFIDSGAIAQPSTIVARLMKTGTLWVRFAIPVEDAKGIEVGSPVRVEAAYLSGAVHARIEKLSEGVDPALGIRVAEARLTMPPEWTGQAVSGRAARVWAEAP